MTETAAGIAGIAALFALLAIRMPVALCLLTVGTAGIAYLNSWPAALATMAGEAFAVASFYPLSVIPLFVLMGGLASVSGMSRDLYDAAHAWVGHWRGGLASATIAGCAGFAAVSGSSVASAVTMGQVALPEMRRYGYSPRLATGAVAAGGTLGILIPPSTGFVLYAVLTDNSIGQLFMAGVLPGLLLASLFMATVALIARRNPALAPRGPRATMAARMRASARAGPLVAIIVVTIGGIYLGVFTPVEAAAIGAFLTLCMAVLRRSLTLAALRKVMLSTVRTTAMALFIVIGAHVFAPFLALTHLPGDLATFIAGLDLGRTATLSLVLVSYVVLGTFLEGLAMLVVTLPIVYPLILTIGVDPIWFGVAMVIMLEMGLITPPVGVNVFVVKGIAEDVPMSEIFKGIAPFWLAMAVCMALLVAFPAIATFLPETMFR